ncbi:MAG: CBS domain-containing protein [Verrucomicrobiaceae bacterium]|nr:CBS domain-containing protein [Verrucomicrobiaceae bacterium]
MEIATPARTLLNHKERHVWTIGPEATVYEAIHLMAGKNVGALPVLDEGKLVGIISERDYMSKVMLRGRSSRETHVREIMTRDVASVGPDQGISECMSIVTERRVRHLPVIEDGRLIGIVSIGDLVKWIIATQKMTIEQLEKYITGGYPG